MKAWNGVEYNEKTRAQAPSSVLSTDHTRADIATAVGAGVIYSDVVP